jgi:hypothetical protein
MAASDCVPVKRRFAGPPSLKGRAIDHRHREFKTVPNLGRQASRKDHGRCRLHGGKSTGPRTPEGLERSRRARLVNSYYTAEAKAARQRRA